MLHPFLSLELDLLNLLGASKLSLEIEPFLEDEFGLVRVETMLKASFEERACDIGLAVL
jgi:hypothetical protein